jgi:ABC-type multidrug transport system fused ATPase/permease subunit
VSNFVVSSSVGLEGSTTIRAFRVERKFAASFRMKVDKNSSAMLNFLSSQRWLGLRIELLGSSVTFLVCLIIVCFNGTLKINPGLVGLVVQWSVVFSAALNFFFIRLSESEAKITSIERIHQTSSLPMEAAWETDPSMSLDPSWPKTGALEFDHVCMRYRKDLPLALDSVSFKLGPGTRCGVVGRTGSGKTSLTTSLFRLVEIESGSIVLDGIDLTKIGLSDVRGRSNGMRIIPQDPVLFAGTLRDCLDPFQTEDDSKLLEALQAVNHNGAKDRGLDVLNDKIDEGGSNYSVGERQLLCLARAIVEEPRVLVLDEATASVDSATDGFIQKMLRTSFRETTLVTIAHRLNTIMDYDVVLVMDEGRAAEFGPPKVLLQDDNGIFTSLVEATGAETASYLRSIADNKSSS